jgi:hypothetical protein
MFTLQVLPPSHNAATTATLPGTITAVIAMTWESQMRNDGSTHISIISLKSIIHILQASGNTLLRVSLSHWIIGDISPQEQLIDGKRWKVFLRLRRWAQSIMY